MADSQKTAVMTLAMMMNLIVWQPQKYGPYTNAGATEVTRYKPYHGSTVGEQETQTTNHKNRGKAKNRLEKAPEGQRWTGTASSQAQ